MPRNETTSKKVASKAATALRDPKSSKREKSIAASALTQAPDGFRKVRKVHELIAMAVSILSDAYMRSKKAKRAIRVKRVTSKLKAVRGMAGRHAKE